MIIKIAYDDQRLDIFDTSTFTEAKPLGKHVLVANFEIRFDTIGEGGLWAAAHTYCADPEYKEESGVDIPVARRQKGWRFLLASAQELEHVELVVVDNEAIIKRVLGQLIDLQAFDEAAYECIGSSNKGIHARIRELRNYLISLTGEVEPVIPGVPRDVVERLMEVKEEEESEEEDWGDLDEIGL